MTSEIVNRLRKNSECLAPSIMLEAADAIERLIAERDEARREVCEMRSEELVDPITSPKQIAQQRGWDCFKEDGK
jgi:hypothetical protein